MDRPPDAAIRSLDVKIAALERARLSLSSSEFIAAVELMLGAPGKVIVTGMGKSGHIGRKIAATFQSTGQRAVFLHPAEAAHGDMGMIWHGDVLLMLSNSGETDELMLILDHAKNAGLPVIAITSRAASNIAAQSDVRIVLPVTEEGDTIGKVPMASTCLQLACGDALAAELMERRGFTAEEFLAIHHGGYLGRKIEAAA